MSATPMELLFPLLTLFTFLVCRVPVALCLAGAGAVGIIMQKDLEHATRVLGSIPHGSSGQYSLSVIPMFILMGVAVSHSGLLGGVFSIANRVTKRLPGGLALAALGASTVLGGISGSSAADAATVGRLSIGEMAKFGYDKAYAAAVVAASGTVSILIPPSIVLVIYGIVTKESIGRLLLAGIVPGLVTVLIYGIVIVYFASRGGAEVGGVPGRSRRAPYRGPAIDVDVQNDNLRSDVTGSRASRAIPDEPLIVERDRTVEVAGAITSVILFSVLIGGLYSGFFTATEAGAMAALCSVTLSLGWALAQPRPGRVGRAMQVLKDSLVETAGLTSMIFLLVVGAGIFAHWLVLAGVPRDMSEWILGLDAAPTLIVIAFLLILLIMGMFIDGLSMLLIMAPIAYPIVVTELGFDGLWFGIMMIKFIEIGLLTPPVGINVFVVAGLFPELKPERIFIRIIPFVIAELICCAVLFIFPTITTFLPNLASPKL